MTDLFDAAAMYDEDYLYFVAAPPGEVEMATHGPVGARAGAATAAVDIEYVSGDMRELPAWTARFDRVVNWSTAFGYFEDAATGR